MALPCTGRIIARPRAPAPSRRHRRVFDGDWVRGRSVVVALFGCPPV